MGRTPLMRALRRAYRRARLSSSLGVPLDEVVEMDAFAAVSRRRVLGGFAGGAVLAACGAAKPTPKMDAKTAAVIVVGAGIAGVHCAYRLKQRGVVASVFEASGWIGGRTSTDRTSFPERMHCELGGELIDSDHTTMHALSRELGIGLYDYDAEPGRNGVTGFVGGRKLTERDMLAAFAPYAPAIKAALEAPSATQTLDQTSVAQWLDAAGVSGDIRKVLEAAYIGEYGLELDVASSLDFLQEIGSDPASFQIFGESDERFHAKTGSVTFVEELAKRVPGQIVTGSRLVALRRASDGRYVATFDRGVPGAVEVRAAHVIVAVPFSILRDVSLHASLGLSPKKLRAIHELAYGTNAKLIVGFEERIWRAQGVGGGEMFTDLDWQTGWETSRMQPGTRGIITNFVGGERGVAMGRGTKEERAKAFLQGFDACVPGAKAAANGVVVRAHWPSNPYTMGSYSGYAVGQETAFGGVEGERAGNLHFCGEHTSKVAQGFMEGGAESGARAAREVLADLGLVAAAP